MEVIGIVVLSTFGYYALKLMTSFRKGMLERGWRLVTFGVYHSCSGSDSISDFAS